ncbi:Signal transduction response regulator [human gut metagenome]|uniref:Signal transduction response regulator n=1 Tax=human gut metagenome TaxID=408170 RepID=K1TKN9_9ZZZZ
MRSKVLCPILFLTARVDEDDKINGLLSVGMIILRNHLVFGSWKQGLSQT